MQLLSYLILFIIHERCFCDKIWVTKDQFGCCVSNDNFGRIQFVRSVETLRKNLCGLLDVLLENMLTWKGDFSGLPEVVLTL